jgi:hypothetical protein
MIILVSIAPLVDNSYYHSGCTDVLSTNGAVLTSITIPVIQMFCPLMKQYSLVLPLLLYRCSIHSSKYCLISGQNISITGMVIIVSTAPLVDRTSVQQE